MEGLNIRALAGLVVPYPTLAEIGKRLGRKALQQVDAFTAEPANQWRREQIENYQRRNRIARQTEDRFAASLGENRRLAGRDRDAVKNKLGIGK